MKKLFSIFMFVFLATAVSVTTFATELLEMNQIAQASNGRKVIQIVDASDFEYYVQYGGSYYIMLEQENWQNITVVSNGNMSSTYIEYDPETMFVINEYGEEIAKYSVIDNITGEPVITEVTYDYAKYFAKSSENYSVVLENPIHIIKVVVKDNFYAFYTEGSTRVEATLGGKQYVAVIEAVNDVIFKNIEGIVNPEEDFYSTKESKKIQGKTSDFLELTEFAPSVEIDSNAQNWITENINEQTEAEPEPIYDSIEFVVGKGYGCSSYYCDIMGEYSERFECPTVLTTRAFSLVAGGKVTIIPSAYDGKLFKITIPKVSSNQNGMNFSYELILNDTYNCGEEIVLRFNSDVPVKSDFYINIDFKSIGASYQALKEFFKINLEESSEVTYYIYNENDVCIGKNTVDYKTIDTESGLSFCVEKNAGEILGTYKIKIYGPGNGENVPEVSQNLLITSKKLISNGLTTVSVNISENSNVAMAQFAVKYDSNVLEIVSASAGELMADATINTETPGIVYFAWDNPEAVTEAGTILDLVFTTAEDAEPCETYIEIDHNERFVFSNANFVDVSLNIQNGKVKIINALYGDLNGDNEINIKDAYIARLIAAKIYNPTEIQLIIGDVDLDGKITALDANILRKYSVKLINKLPV